ncbi:hypothetical protein AYO20_11584 [Fonsecaea nubica]|uniref:Uncharacterized protein n=1 Tax=Fonsecaea nubica TaxID=856822 RepID=A0A178BQ04_9EURO|nr:hypothetical protein AYO20_11584 [Fonsecaea nubica]OAL19730.1 hypothetical protein AYO20_11584 [Fonsecaea nubica]
MKHGRASKNKGKAPYLSGKRTNQTSTVSVVIPSKHTRRESTVSGDIPSKRMRADDNDTKTSDTGDDSEAFWGPPPELPGLRPVEEKDFRSEGYVCLCFWTPDECWLAIRICRPDTDPSVADLLEGHIREAEEWDKENAQEESEAEHGTPRERFLKENRPALWYSDEDGQRLDGYDFAQPRYADETFSSYSWVPQMSCRQFDEAFARENNLPFVDLAIEHLAAFRAAQRQAELEIPAVKEEMPAHDQHANNNAGPIKVEAQASPAPLHRVPETLTTEPGPMNPANVVTDPSKWKDHFPNTTVEAALAAGASWDELVARAEVAAHTQSLLRREKWTRPLSKLTRQLSQWPPPRG